MTEFNQFGLSPEICKTLAAMSFKTPTPIQLQAIPPALEGKDILGTAQTGTGKTGAFGIPLIAKLMKEPHATALVMTPTRELARQVLDMLVQFVGHPRSVKGALLIGGESMNKQLNQLQSRPRLIVGTPGRINDHLKRGSLKLHNTGFLVLDETDRMLDMGFGPQIDLIVKHVPKQRQTLLFSATLPDNIVKMAHKYQNNPLRISVGSTTQPMEKITQKIVQVGDAEKFDTLVSELRQRQGSVIVFVKTKRNADRITEKLWKYDLGAAAIHGNLRQRQRDKVISEFRNEKYRILVATDIAARGLDIPHIQHVINYDLPQVPEDYIHRIGRTARAGAEGESLCILTGHDRAQWREIQRLLDPNVKIEGSFSASASKPASQGKPASKKSFQSPHQKKKAYGRRHWEKKKSPFGNDGEARPQRPWHKKKPCHAKRKFAGKQG
ncbi:MAG: DEAD/DEAH box helicase [Dongiaceae bacterium]